MLLDSSVSPPAPPVLCIKKFEVLGGGGEGGAALHRGSVRISRPAAPGSILGIPKNVSDEILILDVAEINRRHFLECGKA